MIALSYSLRYDNIEIQQERDEIAMDINDEQISEKEELAFLELEDALNFIEDSKTSRQLKILIDSVIED